MTTTYCEAKDVKRILQKSASFSQGTAPSVEEIDTTINRFERYFDNQTQHAWRSTLITNEYHDLPIGPYNLSTGRPIKLLHRSIRTFTSGTHKIEVWDGANWVDWISDANYQEGRGKDYWIDYENGVIYLKLRYTYHWQKAIRVTYAYGEDNVPEDVRDAVALFTAAEILTSDDRVMVTAETGDPTRMPHDIRASSWRKTANTILNSYKEVTVL